MGSVVYSYTEKKRIRKDFGKHFGAIEAPPLLELQRESYSRFLQADTEMEARGNFGLHAAFLSVFPITSFSGGSVLEYAGYQLGEPVFDVRECRMRGLTYGVSLRVKVRLVHYAREAVGDAKVVHDVREQEVLSLTELNVLLFPSCIVPLEFSLSTIGGRLILQESCYFLLASFHIVDHGLILNLIQRTVFMSVSTDVASCQQLSCYARLNILLKIFSVFSLKTIFFI
jgi:DNA-directed RNA polymerase beta subunit